MRTLLAAGEPPRPDRTPVSSWTSTTASGIAWLPQPARAVSLNGYLVVFDFSSRAVFPN